MENDPWIWFLMAAAVYLLSGFIVYVIIEARVYGEMESADYFSPWEMAFIVFTWPLIALYILNHWRKNRRKQ
jgi:hypothetical protein